MHLDDLLDNTDKSVSILPRMTNKCHQITPKSYQILQGQSYPICILLVSPFQISVSVAQRPTVWVLTAILSQVYSE